MECNGIKLPGGEVMEVEESGYKGIKGVVKFSLPVDTVKIIARVF